MKEIIAIDPGKTGAICRLTLNTDFSIKEFVVEPSLFNKKTARFDSDNLFYFLKPSSNKFNTIIGICIEEVHSMFQMSAKSNFTFGRNLGQIEGVIDFCLTFPIFGNLEISYLQPKVWQKVIKEYFPLELEDKWSKEVALKYAIEIMNKLNLKNKDKIQEIFYSKRGRFLDGNVDAFLIAIAYYYKHIYYGTNSI